MPKKKYPKKKAAPEVDPADDAVGTQGPDEPQPDDLETDDALVESELLPDSHFIERFPLPCLVSLHGPIMTPMGNLAQHLWGRIRLVAHSDFAPAMPESTKQFMVVGSSPTAQVMVPLDMVAAVAASEHPPDAPAMSLFECDTESED